MKIKDTVNLLYQVIVNRPKDLSRKDSIRNFFSLLFQASHEEQQALLKATNHLFSAMYASRQIDQQPKSERYRVRRLFQQLLYLPETIALRSKWLASITSIVLFFSTVVLTFNRDINLFAFSAVYLLALFLSGSLSLYHWIKSPKKLAFDYLPGIYSFVTIYYVFFIRHDLESTLPRSMFYLLLIWVGIFLYQSYKIRAVLPDISKTMWKWGLFGALLALMSYRFTSLLEFLVSTLLILLLLYKAILTALIAFKSWYYPGKEKSNSNP